ncbi:MAG: S8 family serine peptidase [Halobaculum sp.]
MIGSAFDRDHPSLTGRVAAAHRIGGMPWFLQRRDPSLHDTAVAEIVAQRSPSANLYLAAVGRSPTPEQYTRAVNWLLARDVDVIVDAGSYFPRTSRGVEQFESAAARAAEAGAVFVTSAGNYADQHWRGRPSGTGWVSFAPGVKRNELGTGVVSGRVTLRLYWEGRADYDLYLYRDVPGPRDELVAKSARATGSTEAIDTVVPKGRYYVAVYARTGSVPVDLFAPGYSLAHADAAGSSLPPATARGVIAVGSVGPNGALRAYTSSVRDVSAADGVQTDAVGEFSGTSAAAPIVAGTVSSMVAETDDEKLSPSEIETILQQTATGEVNRVDADAAVARAANVTDGGTVDGP